MTIVERALEFVEDGRDDWPGLRPRRAEPSYAALGERVQKAMLRVRGVATSEETAALPRQVGIPLVDAAGGGRVGSHDRRRRRS